jgi:hypothetical protein
VVEVVSFDDGDVDATTLVTAVFDDVLDADEPQPAMPTATVNGTTIVAVSNGCRGEVVKAGTQARM